MECYVIFVVNRYIGSTAVARLVGVCLQTVYKWHGRKLHPKKNVNGDWVYNREEVLEFAKWYQKTRPRFYRSSQSEGEKAARAFQLFEAGFTVSQVVMHVGIAPPTAESWYASWQRDNKNLPFEHESIVALEVKKTALEIKREELALKKVKRKDVERRISKRMEREFNREREEQERENPLPELPKRENTPLQEVFEHAAGVKK